MPLEHHDRTTLFGHFPSGWQTVFTGDPELEERPYLHALSSAPGPATIRSVFETLAAHGVAPVAEDVGGTQRRSCVLNVSRGRVTYSLGDSESRMLWESVKEVTV